MDAKLSNKLKIQELVEQARLRSLKPIISYIEHYKFNLQSEERFDAECGPLPINVPEGAHKSLANDQQEESKDVKEIELDSKFTWNKEQSDALHLALETEDDFCLIGAAGTGKTTLERGIITNLIQRNKIMPMPLGSKFLSAGSPGLAIVSFTRRAVQAAKRQLSEDIKRQCLTIHKLLEYEPVFFDVLDTQTGMMKKTMRFEPMRHKKNPISDLQLVIIDESSMCSVELHQQLKDACPNARFIYVGDIQQLPPVYGSAILGFKMLEIPVVELTQVYRQALESPIIRLAHRILSGKPIPPSEYSLIEQKPELIIHPFKKRVEAESCIIYVKKFFSNLCLAGKFNPETDVILCPFNEAFGTLELNRAIAQTLSEMRNAPVWEIYSGFHKHYLAVGDRVLVDKQDGIVKEIVHNGLYVGKRPHKPTTAMNRYGNYTRSLSDDETDDDLMGEDDIERMLELTDSREDEERKNQASHIIKIAPVVDGEEHESFTWDLSTAGEVNQLLFSYALTVHKSQGSEWERVYFIMHHSHNTMCQREMLYTAVTRAKKYLYIICEGRSRPDKEDSTFETGIRSQRIKGNTLKEKAEFFKGKLEAGYMDGKEK